jgi:hypothetical protein
MGGAGRAGGVGGEEEVDVLFGRVQCGGGADVSTSFGRGFGGG